MLIAVIMAFAWPVFDGGLPHTAPVDKTPSYQVYPTDKGLRITTTYGQIDLPWRWIHGIGTALNA